MEKISKACQPSSRYEETSNQYSRLTKEEQRTVDKTKENPKLFDESTRSK